MKRHVELNGARSKKFICPPGNVFNSISSPSLPWSLTMNDKNVVDTCVTPLSLFFLQTVDIVFFCITHPTRYYLGKCFSLYSQSLRNFFLKKTDNNPDFNTQAKKSLHIFREPPSCLIWDTYICHFHPLPQNHNKISGDKKNGGRRQGLANVLNYRPEAFDLTFISMSRGKAKRR